VTVETLTYVLPIRCGADHGAHDELATYLRALADVCEVLVVDGSEPSSFAEHATVFPATVRHIAPDADLAFLNGKVDGITTGVRRAGHDRIVLADDDVRYRLDDLRAVSNMLEDDDVVAPQNYFQPLPWHARWDTARMLINRAFAHDYPGTLGVRRSTFLAMGGYDGDVMFENLELLRTVVAHGGSVRNASDVFVRRVPPSAATFWSQRVRQAYDDLAQPLRLAVELAVLPLVAWSVVRHRPHAVVIAVGAVAIAEAGRRRGGAVAVVPPDVPLFAPAWVAERAVCVWLAVVSRLVLGGVRYRGARIARAASPVRSLRRRAPMDGGACRAAAVVEPPSVSTDA
jgi:hypothetical protein